MRYGYARTSSIGARADRQSTLPQEQALKASGCELIVIEHGSGSKKDRPVMNEFMNRVVEGDSITVLRLDRWGRSLVDLLQSIQVLKERSVDFRSLTESLDTSSAAGMLTVSVLGAAAQYEKTLLVERLAESRKATGRHGGRPKSLTEANIRLARRLVNEGESVVDVGRQFGCSKRTIYRALSFSACHHPSR
jgi:DNA invertase Pin-like site-specific DNA recombinase